MSSRAEDFSDVADVGLLSPVSAGTVAEAVTGDRAVVAAMVRAEAALVRALVETKLAPDGAAAAARAIDGADPDPRALALAATEGGNPVIPLVEHLRAAAGRDNARWVHFGTTSQDILDTALMLVASEVAWRIISDLTRLAGTLARLAEETRSVPLVARTLTQQALPTTLGLRVSGWLAGVHDAVRVVRTCTALPVSLGGPVGTGSAYGADGPAVVEAFARILGQRAPVASWHTRRTPMIGLATALTVAGAACGKIAADLLVMSQTEVGEAREGTGGSSSAMAHKANPAQSVLVASAARQLPALGAVIGGSAAAELERPAGAWHAEWQPLRMMLRLAGGAVERTADLVSGVHFDHDAMRRNLDQLVDTVGKDEAWVRAHLEHVDAWIDRVLAQHEEVFG
ncbi:MAG TPA: lyase family protein [Nocardioidaceae bacterium]|nr:lyase family protein [Nocardioidaceae bacterium]